MNQNKLSIFTRKSISTGLVDIETKPKINKLSLSFIENGRNSNEQIDDLLMKVNSHCNGYLACSPNSDNETWCYRYRDCNNLFDRNTCRDYST